MERINMLPPAFLCARLDLIERELEGIPNVSIGRHKGRDIIRQYYDDNGVRRYHEYLMSGKKGSQLLELSRRKEELIRQRKNLGAMLISSGIPDVKAIRCSDTNMDKAYFDSLNECANPIEAGCEYRHRGISMRSRGEVIIAEALDSLGFEYKYEPRVIVDGELFYPDFVVFLPEFGRCFFIEFLGMLDNRRYAHNNGMKISHYLRAGFVINKDLLLFSGTKNSMDPIDVIVEDLVMLTSRFCKLYF